MPTLSRRFVDSEGPAGDDRDANPTQKALRHRNGQLPYHRDVVLIRRRKRRREVAELLEAQFKKHPRGTVCM
jgi:hypothetical protein